MAAKFCNRCQAIFDSEELGKPEIYDRPAKQFMHQETEESFERSVASGCAICSCLNGRIHEFRESNHVSLGGRAGYSSYSLFETVKGMYLYFYVGGKILLSLILVSRKGQSSIARV